jgi:hypothetical protein
MSMNNPRNDWEDIRYGEQEALRQGAMYQAGRDAYLVRRLEIGQDVRTPDGWTGHVAEIYRDKGQVYVESWENSGTYWARELEPVIGSDFDFSGGGL